MMLLLMLMMIIIITNKPETKMPLLLSIFLEKLFGILGFSLEKCLIN